MNRLLTKLNRIEYLARKVFCPTGPGGGVDPTCSPGKGSGDVGAGLGSVSMFGGYDVSTSMEENFSRTVGSLLSGVDKQHHGELVQTVANVAGVEPGSNVEITVRKDNIRVSYTNEEKGIKAERLLMKDNNGDTIVYNMLFKVNESNRGKGFGLSMLQRQIEHASSRGVKRITTHAAGSYQSDMNGYYTWPRLGYDGPVPPFLAKEFPGKTRLSDIMADSSARDKWKRLGEGVDVQFDLSEGSQSRQVFDAYRKERAARKG